MQCSQDTKVSHNDEKTEVKGKMLTPKQPPVNGGEEQRQQGALEVCTGWQASQE
jgi:hypothetical protein